MIFVMKNLKFSFLITALFFFASCSPQSKGESRPSTQKCELELKDFPTFRGLKIGMQFELNPMSFDNQKYNPQYRTDSSVKNPSQEIENPQELGYNKRRFHVSRIREQLKDQNLANSIDTKNLDNIDVEVFDGKLIQFTLYYDETMKSPSIINTTDKFAESLKLPNGSFEISSSWAYCYCKDFTVNIRGGSQIELDVSPNLKVFYNISNVLIERDKERTQRKQNTFNP